MTWTLHLYELNIENIGNTIVVISTILFIYFGIILVFDIFRVFGLSLLDEEDHFDWAMFWVDIVVCLIGLYTATRGWVAHSSKTNRTARHFRVSMIILAIFYIASLVIFYIYDFKDIFEFADDHYSVNMAMFIVVLVISVLVCGCCCFYCYS